MNIKFLPNAKVPCYEEEGFEVMMDNESTGILGGGVTGQDDYSSCRRVDFPVEFVNIGLFGRENDMGTISLPENLLNKLEFIEGKDVHEKFKNLLETNVLMRLKECEDWIYRYESKYGMDFQDFEKVWESGVIENKHSHSVERDFMEWEGFEIERKKWLDTIREIRVEKR